MIGYNIFPEEKKCMATISYWTSLNMTSWICINRDVELNSLLIAEHFVSYHSWFLGFWSSSVSLRLQTVASQSISTYNLRWWRAILAQLVLHSEHVEQVVHVIVWSVIHLTPDPKHIVLRNRSIKGVYLVNSELWFLNSYISWADFRLYRVI